MNDLFNNNLSNKYIVLDTETESLNLNISRPWSVAWLVVENGQIIEKFDKYPLFSDLEVSKGAMAVTRFTYLDYQAKSEDAKGVYELLKTYLYNPDYMVVGQNFISFDSYQLKNFALAVGDKIDYSYMTRTIDTLSLARSYKLDMKPRANDINTPNKFLSWQYRMLSIKKKGLKCSLEALCKDFGIKEYSLATAHSGAQDIVWTNEVFKRLVGVLGVNI